MMRGLWLALLMSLGLFAQADSQVPSSIRMASDVWIDRINPDGTGLSWDVLRKVFEPAGVRLDMQIVPYTRSIGLVKRGEADAWVASYQNEVSGGVVYPQWHYDSDLISALSLGSKPEPDQAQLGRSRLVWMRGYEYQRYIPGLTHYNELQRRSGILSMLDQGHADYYIDARPEVEQVLAGAEQPGKYRATDLLRLPLYIGFSDTPRGRALAKLFDQRMAELVEKDELRAIFERWGQHYPFE